MKPRTATALVVLAILTSGCSGDSSGGPDSAQRASGASTSTSTAPEHLDAAGAPGGTNRSPADETPSDGPTTTAVSTDAPDSIDAQAGEGGADRREPLEVEAQLASACVKPGGKQTITVRTVPEAAVSYGSTYSNGTTAFDKTFPGGNNSGRTDPGGVWTDSWVVGLGAPAGPVRVDVAALSYDQETGFTTASFAVAGTTGKCG